MSDPTTYVLVHGAWHDGRSWNRVAPLLTAQGHRVFTPSLSGHGDKAHLLGPEVVTDPDDIAWLKTTLADGSVLCFQQPAEMDHPAQALIPRVHILCVGSEPEGVTRRPIPETQPNGEPSRVHRLETGHDSMITKPVELSDLLLENT